MTNPKIMSKFTQHDLLCYSPMALVPYHRGRAPIKKEVAMLAFEEIKRNLMPYKAKLIEMGDSL